MCLCIEDKSIFSRFEHDPKIGALAQTTGFALGFEKRNQITLTDGALDVANKRAVGVVKELDTHLSHTTSGTCAAQNLRHLSNFRGLFLRNTDELESLNKTSVVPHKRNLPSQLTMVKI